MILISSGHLAVSGDVFCSHILGWGGASYIMGRVTGAAKHPVMH